MIELRDLYLRRGSRTVVRGVSCTLSTGITALVGHNGAGKTSLIRSLCGLLPPAQGTVLLDQEDLYGAGRSLRTRGSAVGWMPQEPTLPSRSRVRELVEYAAWMRGVAPADLSQVAERAARQVNLQDRTAVRVGRLSGGERRRVALACALVDDPAILVLDEPTVGLDPHQREAFLAGLTDRTSTTILSTHLLEDVLDVAERVLVLSDGHLVNDVQVAELEGIGQGGDAVRQFRNLLFETERAGEE